MASDEMAIGHGYDSSSEADKLYPGLNQAIATLILGLSAITFLLPTLLGLSIVGYNESLPIVWLIGILFPLNSFSGSDQLSFLREFWTALPALILGIFAAQHRTKRLTFVVLAIVMVIIAIGGSLSLHIF
ncbi:hypothetical protein [uncultured Jannaschia sp.]|uniref:hypothetical protein n=1 Tax=uncultured Jannaschia sp. TaxID=293347 RepID=UPI00261C8F5B|nr:hypothetical protein [uncultured Jannaschia sp.]